MQENLQSLELVLSLLNLYFFSCLHKKLKALSLYTTFGETKDNGNEGDREESEEPQQDETILTSSSSSSISQETLPADSSILTK